MWTAFGRPRAAVLARPLQHLEVATLRRGKARLLVPRAVVLVRPLQHLGGAALRRDKARILVPTLTAAPHSMQPNGEVVNKKAINYSNLWPIALAPVIPAVGIALR